MRNGWTIPEYRYKRFVVTGTCDEGAAIWWYRPDVGVQERIICGGVTLNTALAAGNRLVKLGLWDGTNYLTQALALQVQGPNVSCRYFWLDGLQGHYTATILEIQIPWGYEVWIDHNVSVRGSVHNMQIDDLFFTPILLVERTIAD